jgi:hypothetical protein
MMELNKTIKVSVGLYLIGMAAFALFTKGWESCLWYSISGGLALINVFFAAWTVKFGFKSVTNKGLFFGLLFIKSMTFLMMVIMVLVILKPLVLPFTLGISVVIFGAVGAAIYEAGPLLRRT